MLLVDKKLQKTKLTLSLLAVLHSPLLRADQSLINTDPESAYKNSSADTSSLQDQPGVSLVWPILPGDSINSLAALFYPKNKVMQQRFINKTLQLNQPLAPALDPAARANLVSLILIPDIKTLGKNSGKIIKSLKHRKKSSDSSLHLSYQLKNANDFIVSDKMQADYQNLLDRNTQLKTDLATFNAKLLQLQQILAALKTQALVALSRLEPVAAIKKSTVIKTADIPKPLIIQPTVNQTVQNVSLLKTLKPFPPETETALDKPFEIDPIYWWGLSIGLLALITMIFSWRAYMHKQAKNLYLAATGEFDLLQSGIFNQINEAGMSGYQNDLTKLDFSLTQNGLSESMSVVDLSNVEGLDYKEEGELILEQARIYLNIGRLDEATDLLKAQIKAMPKDSLHHWLYLLDIYRDHQLKNEFLHYAKQLHETFNVMMPLWDNAKLPIVMASSLEEFPHIVQELTGLWADSLDKAKAYIDDLINDNRSSERAGFSMDVFQELVVLHDLITAREKIAAST